jgi:rhodanese-related sulfurtransferase
VKRPELSTAAALLLIATVTIATESFRIIHVDDLARLLADKEAKAVVLDANPPSVRDAKGVIPGARLLSSSASYEVTKELPAAKDTKLVFYCANTH